MAHDSGATLVVDSLSAVDPERHTVTTGQGQQLTYDALLIAVGAEPYAAVPGAKMWTHDSSPEIMGGLLRDMEEGYSRRVAFVQPDAPCWPPPVYELAMMCARDVYGMNIDDAEVTVVIPERVPLIAFGEKASAMVAAELKVARVATRAGAGPRIERHGHTLSLGNGEQLDVDRVVALPGLRGPSTPGLPRDADGFLVIDERGRVNGVPSVWAIGDGTNTRLKQGGLAAQQADLAARDILARALGHEAPEPQAPVLRGMLLTASRVYGSSANSAATTPAGPPTARSGGRRARSPDRGWATTSPFPRKSTPPAHTPSKRSSHATARVRSSSRRSRCGEPSPRTSSLHDGEVVRVRPVETSDEKAGWTFLDHLSLESRCRRFLHRRTGPLAGGPLGHRGESRPRGLVAETAFGEIVGHGVFVRARGNAPGPVDQRDSRTVLGVPGGKRLLKVTGQ